MKALAKLNFTTPTPIQEKAIPVGLEGTDIIGAAQTGTGKTAAFCIPMITHLLQNPNKRALVVTPTRELAIQVADVVSQLTSFIPSIRHTIVVGGASMNVQLQSLRRNPKVIIATPGRLLDHVDRRTINLKTTDILVLDEADRMFDMGFAPDIEEIISFLPPKKQIMLFSATFPPKIRALALSHLKNPVSVTIAQDKPIEKITQVVVKTTGPNKRTELLAQIDNRPGSILIFARTKFGTDKLSHFLEKAGCSVTRIHGDRSQKQRQQAIEGFRNGFYRILVATDIAARGLDIPGIEHVINFDLPKTAEEYIHRIGRTARAGASGEAVAFVTPEETGLWKTLTFHLDKISNKTAKLSQALASRSEPRKVPVVTARVPHQVVVKPVEKPAKKTFFGFRKRRESAAR